MTQRSDSTFAKAPPFTPCESCGELTLGPECFECVRKRERANEAARELEATIPEMFKWARFGAAEVTKRVRRPGSVSLARASTGLTRVVLTGAPGVGKTVLSVAMAREWVKEKAQPATFVLTTDLATARMKTPFGREAELVDASLRTPLLVLDDLGSDQPVNTSAVGEVVFKRHAESRPTWITTWMSPDEVAARYGAGISRRVFEGVRIIHCGAA